MTKRKKPLRFALFGAGFWAHYQLAAWGENPGAVCVGVCLDTVNNLGALEGPSEVVTILAPYTINLHVKDVIIRRKSHRLGFEVEGRPAGQGMVDIPAILALMSEDVSGTLELWTVPELALEDTLNKETVWAEQSVTHLKSLMRA